MSCNHSNAYKYVAVEDGMCPLCMQEEINYLQKDSENTQYELAGAEKEVNKLTLLLEEIRRVASEPIPENYVGGAVDWPMIKLHKVWKIADSAFLEE